MYLILQQKLKQKTIVFKMEAYSYRYSIFVICQILSMHKLFLILIPILKPFFIHKFYEGKKVHYQ